MICPYCGHDNDKVIDSRASEGGFAIRRRRECNRCDRRFTTYERVEESGRLSVIKRDGSRAPFNREKLLLGIQAACGKRPIPEGEKRRIVETVEDQLHREFDREVESRVIGERVAMLLRDIDEIAYIRFASEYFRFEEVGEIMDELQGLANRVKVGKEQKALFEEDGA